MTPFTSHIIWFIVDIKKIRAALSYVCRRFSCWQQRSNRQLLAMKILTWCHCSCLSGYIHSGCMVTSPTINVIYIIYKPSNISYSPLQEISCQHLFTYPLTVCPSLSVIFKWPILQTLYSSLQSSGKVKLKIPVLVTQQKDNLQYDGIPLSVAVLRLTKCIQTVSFPTLLLAWIYGSLNTQLSHFLVITSPWTTCRCVIRFFDTYLDVFNVSYLFFLLPAFICRCSSL